MKILEVNHLFGLNQVCTGKGNGGAGCGSKLFVEEDDVYLTHRTYLTGETDFFYTFRCPVCNHETDIEDKLVPSIIQNNLLSQYREKVLRR